MQKRKVSNFLILGAIAILLIFSFVELISAQSNVGQDPISNFFKKLWDEIITSFATGSGISEQLARILYFVIVLLLVYSVLDKIPSFSNPNLSWLRGLMAVIIAFLSVAYLTTADIYALLLSYSGLGFALGTILPFLILVFFSYDLITNPHIKHPGATKLLVMVLWGSFSIWNIYRYITLPVATGEVAAYARPSLLLVIFFSVMGLIFAGSIIKYIRRIERNEVIESTADKVKKTRAAVNQLSEFEEGGGI